MTHDDLLIEINRRLDVAYYNGDPQSMRALRAVVELHKPTNGHDRNICLACSPEILMPYPCPTIQTIQEQLK
jgi:hypothetical protein